MREVRASGASVPAFQRGVQPSGASHSHSLALELPPSLPRQLGAAQGESQPRSQGKASPGLTLIIAVTGEPDSQPQVSLPDGWQSAAGGLPGGDARGGRRAFLSPESGGRPSAGPAPGAHAPRPVAFPGGRAPPARGRRRQGLGAGALPAGGGSRCRPLRGPRGGEWRPGSWRGARGGPVRGLRSGASVRRSLPGGARSFARAEAARPGFQPGAPQK